MSPVLRSASPRAKSAAISAAGNRGFTDGSVGAGIAAAETVAAADAALATGAGVAAAMVGRGSFDSVAGSALAPVEIVRFVELSWAAAPGPSEAAVATSRTVGVDPVSDRSKLGTESAAAAVGAVKGTSDVAWRFEPVGVLVAAGGGDVAREAFVNP